MNCRVERVLVENGRAAGVEGTYTDEDGRLAQRSSCGRPTVVVAGGSLETPALLLRSGIGGPAAGEYLRLHPATAVVGVYDEPQKGWWGPPQTGLSHQFADLEDGYGFLIEAAHATPGLTRLGRALGVGAGHKELMSQAPETAGFVFLIRDRGHGQVTIDRDGNAVHSYHITDELDDRIFRRGAGRAGQAARGGRAPRRSTRCTASSHLWRRGEDLEAFAERVARRLDRARTSTRPSRCTRWARPDGQRPGDERGRPVGPAARHQGRVDRRRERLPDARRGTNPMITTMALAHRTAEAIVAAR